MNIRTTLQHLGFTSKETAVYITTLELGMAPISVIARRSGLKRSTAYEILKKLSEKGVAEFFLKKRTRYYSVIPPKALLLKYQSHVEDLHAAVPELQAISNAIVRKPSISFYEGKEDLKRLYLGSLESTGEILNYFLPEKILDYFGREWIVDVYIQERVKQGLWVRTLMPVSPIATDMLNKGDVELRRARIVQDPTIDFSNEIYIYNNTMTIFSFEDDMAVCIESPQVASTQRAIFELAWKGAALSE